MSRRVLIRVVAGGEVLPTLVFPSSYGYVPSGDVIECSSGSPFLRCRVYDGGFVDAEGVYKLVSMVARIEPRSSAFGEPSVTSIVGGASYVEQVLGDVAARVLAARLERGGGWGNEALLLVWDVQGAGLWWGLVYDAVADAVPVAEACGLRVYRVGDAKFYHVRRPLSRLVETRVGRVVALDSGHALIPADMATYLKYATTSVATRARVVFAAALTLDRDMELVVTTAECRERVTLSQGDYIAIHMDRRA